MKNNDKIEELKAEIVRTSVDFGVLSCETIFHMVVKEVKDKASHSYLAFETQRSAGRSTITIFVATLTGKKIGL